jgi:serine protease Do
MRKRRYRGVAAMLVAVLLGTATFVAPVRAQEMDISRSHLVPSLLPTVVNILAHSAVSADPQTTMRASSDSSGDSFQIKDSAGSGFIVDATGVIVTNWHVVDGAYEIFVTFSDGQRAKAGLLNEG